MKRLLKSCIAGSLAFFARLIVRKYRPIVVMVTGSVGKTSTKDAIAAALSQRAFIRASEKSYNSEFGVPFTILGVKNPWTNPISWLRVYEEALALLLLPNHYPRMLVLEVGADRPGDLAKILKITLPDAVVVTRLPEVPVHVEAYSSPEAVREEEFVPAYGLAPGSPLIISAEDAYARAYAERLPVSVSTFGFAEDAVVRVEGPRVWTEGGAPAGMEASMRIREEHHTVRVPCVLGTQQLLAPAAALALLAALDMDIESGLAGLGSFASPPGRMHLLKGVKDTVLIDDTYNSSPAAVEESLNALSLIPGKRRVALLGDMLELGRYSVAEHERVGAYAAAHADILVTIGIRSRAIAEAARQAGFPEANIHEYDASQAAAQSILSIVEQGDIILIKGSQSIRMERITQVLLADPLDAKQLVRQDAGWKRR